MRLGKGINEVQGSGVNQGVIVGDFFPFYKNFVAWFIDGNVHFADLRADTSTCQDFFGVLDGFDGHVGDLVIGIEIDIPKDEFIGEEEILKHFEGPLVHDILLFD